MLPVGAGAARGRGAGGRWLPPALTPLLSQFQFGGDSLKGPTVSFQEAQAQAILQQAKVRTPAPTPAPQPPRSRLTPLLFSPPSLP